jgi:hypothetical protein
MAGAGQREAAARQEAVGEEPWKLSTDCPSAVSETAGTSHGSTSAHAQNSTNEWPGRCGLGRRITRQRTMNQSDNGPAGALLGPPHGGDPERPPTERRSRTVKTRATRWLYRRVQTTLVHCTRRAGRGVDGWLQVGFRLFRASRVDQRGSLQSCRDRRAALGEVPWLLAGSFDDAGEFDSGLYAECAEDLP